MDGMRFLRSTHHFARVIVDPQKINGGSNTREVIALQRQRSNGKRSKEVLWIAGREDGIEKPAIDKCVRVSGGLKGFGPIVFRIDRTEIQRDTQLRRFGGMGAQTWQRQPMREQQMMTGQKRRAHISYTWSMNADTIAQKGSAPGFIVRQPPIHPIS